ncbi:hypothetical protein Tco_1370041 [Tanacetum coccineum]
MAKQFELNKQKGKATGQWENRPVWNNVQRMNHQNKFVPKAVLTKTGIFPVNTARQNISSQAATISTARKVNTARPIVNEIRPRTFFISLIHPLEGHLIEQQHQKLNFQIKKLILLRSKQLVLLGAKGKLLLSPQQVVIGDPKDITRTKSLNTIVDQALFWNTTSSQIVNDEKQIHAIVDSKAVVVTEASIRSSLILNDVVGDQPFETSSSSSHDTTQDSRDSLEGTNESAGDQVQPSPDSPLLGGPISNKFEGGMTLEELSILCTNLSNRVLALEASKDAQAAKIIKLKTRIKKLKKKSHPLISHHRAWLRSVSRLSMKRRLGRKEFVSKQGRKNAKPEPKPTLDAFDDLDADGRDYMETEDVVKEGRQISTARPELSTARPDVDAARQEDSAVEPRTPPITTSIFDDEDIPMAQTLIKMKEEKAKEKGVSIKDIEDSSRPERSILTLKPLLTIDPKDKEIARQLQADLQAEVERERHREEEASKAAIAETYDEVQARIDADALFVAKFQQEEREEYTIEERAKFLAEIIAAQRKFKVAQRSAEIRSRPPTKSQLGNLMMTVIDDFKPMDSDDAVKDSKETASVNKQDVFKEPNSTKIEVKQEGHEESIWKRPGRRLKMKATKKSKRQKTDADLEEEEQLKAYLKIVPDEEGIIDYEVVEKRFPIINWESKFYDFDRHGTECIYYRIFRSNGSSRFETTTPEGVDLVLWGDLRTMFNAHAEDELWQNQERWNLKR